MIKKAYFGRNVLQAIDARSQILDIEESLKGDKYAMIRDFYLQRKAFQIAEKKGDSNDISFISMLMIPMNHLQMSNNFIIILLQI
jgi:phospholipid-binding lipoprotein MlaA